MFLLKSAKNMVRYLQNMQALRKMLSNALNQSVPSVSDSCPECGAGSDEREFTGRDFLGIEAIHMYYSCNKCGSEITEEFTLSDVFIDNGQ